ncbi:hypothetical protein niasHT_035683 [Heterodera trifolii]|uniref:Protein kinase domain-containing protein n=1 Tax=Heterodera trifolii TaxID=157864 RepID=A0ABD2IBK5_9BILA
MKKFNYIVMSLVGRGLDGVVKEAGGRLSLGSAVGVSIQMLAALRGLHTVGYLHRDIKPGNSTIGRPESNEIRLLYLIDFGMARKYIKDDGSQHRPRAATNFRGSPRYAAISAHLGREYSRKDDIESWFYCMIELFKGALPWSNVGEMKAIGDAKAIADLLSGCPSEFGQVLKYIDDMKYTDKPDYDWIIATLRSSLSNAGVRNSPTTGRRASATRHRALEAAEEGEETATSTDEPCSSSRRIAKKRRRAELII